MSEPTHTVTNESVSVVIEGKMYTIKRGDENFEAAKAAVLSKEWDKVPALVSRGMMVQDWAEKYAAGDFVFVDGLMRYQGNPVAHQLNQRMIELAKGGKDPTFLMKFWRLLDENPSGRSVTQLYDFLAHNNIAIDQEGYILAYKSVKRDYTDHHSGKFDNSVGRENKMPRNQISDDPRASCAAGFHVGALEYARTFGVNGRMIICRVHPKDVVSVPYDSKSQKMRVCRYKVIGNYGGDMGPIHDTHKDEATRDIVSGADKFADKLKGKSAPPKTANEAAAAADPVVAVKRDAGTAKEEPWLAFNDLSDADLAKQRVWDLRKYASRVIGIVGASKLKKDGPEGLVAMIVSTRKK